MFPHVLFLLAVIAAACGDCTLTKFGTYIYDCRNQNLTSVPEYVPAQAEVVDLSQNQIQQIEEHSFVCYPPIKELYLADNDISSIDRDGFTSLTNLSILDLSDNSISNFHVRAPSSLEILYLDGNNVTNSVFNESLPKLRYLSLVGDYLVDIPTISNFTPTLQYFDLRNNPLSNISSNELLQFQNKNLIILYLSSDVLGGKDTVDKCYEFVRIANELNIEAKFFSCYNNESFSISSTSFNRQYSPYNAMPDKPENVLVYPEPTVPNNSLAFLQEQTSAAMTNFIRSMIVEYNTMEPMPYNVTEPLKLDDYANETQQIRFYNVFMSGFPAFNIYEYLLNLFSVDAEYLKRFQIQFQTSDPAIRNITITGNYKREDTEASFSCELIDTDYETNRNMVRRYDAYVLPDSISETINYRTMSCTSSDANENTAELQDAVLAALAQIWFPYACSISDRATLEPLLVGFNKGWVQQYQTSIFYVIIANLMNYLRVIYVGNFDVTSNDEQNTTYNVNVSNLFDYAKYNAKYSSSADFPLTALTIDVTNTISYNDNNTAQLVVSNNTSINVSSILQNFSENVIKEEKVFKLHIDQTRTNVTQQTPQQNSSVVSLVIDAFQENFSNQTLIVIETLTKLIDFYSLNVA